MYTRTPLFVFAFSLCFFFFLTFWYLVHLGLRRRCAAAFKRKRSGQHMFVFRYVEEDDETLPLRATVF